MVNRWSMAWTVQRSSADANTLGLPPMSSRGIALISVDALMLFLAITWTLMRIWVRRFKKMSILFIEDILCYFALVRT